MHNEQKLFDVLRETLPEFMDDNSKKTMLGCFKLYLLMGYEFVQAFTDDGEYGYILMFDWNTAAKVRLYFSGRVYEY